MSCTARGKLRLPNQLPSPAQLAQIPVGIYCLDPRSTCALRQVKGAIIGQSVANWGGNHIQ